MGGVDHPAAHTQRPTRQGERPHLPFAGYSFIPTKKNADQQIYRKGASCRKGSPRTDAGLLVVGVEGLKNKIQQNKTILGNANGEYCAEAIKKSVFFIFST